MSVADNVRSLSTAARPAIRAWLDAAEELKALRQAATDKGIDWSALKSLLVAQERDADDGGERVKKLLGKFDTSLTYADMIVAERQKTSPQFKSAASPPSGGEGALASGKPAHAPSIQSRGGGESRPALNVRPDTPELDGDPAAGQVVKSDGAVSIVSGLASQGGVATAPRDTFTEIVAAGADTHASRVSTLAGTGVSSGGSGVEITDSDPFNCTPDFLRREVIAT